MNEFETLMANEELIRMIFDICLRFTIAGVVFITILYIGASYFGIDIKFPIMFYLNIPRLVVSGLAFALVFCYDYSQRAFTLPRFHEMLMSTFLVGILAFIEILSVVASCYNDILEIIKHNKKESKF